MHNWKTKSQNSIIFNSIKHFKRKEKNITHLTLHVQDLYARSLNGDERDQRPTEMEKDTVSVN